MSHQSLVSGLFISVSAFYTRSSGISKASEKSSLGRERPNFFKASLGRGSEKLSRPSPKPGETILPEVPICFCQTLPEPDTFKAEVAGLQILHFHSRRHRAGEHGERRWIFAWKSELHRRYEP